MPQLDTLTYFSQFIFLLVSFLCIYYFVITYILPNTLTARKLRAKFNSQLESSKGLLQVPSELELCTIECKSAHSGAPDHLRLRGKPNEVSLFPKRGQAFIGEAALESLTAEAYTQLACKNAASSTVEDLKAINKTGKHSIQSALMLHYTYALANKKGLIDSELTAA